MVQQCQFFHAQLAVQLDARNGGKPLTHVVMLDEKPPNGASIRRILKLKLK